MKTLDEVTREFMSSFQEVCKRLGLNHTCKVEDVDPDYVYVSINDGEHTVIMSGDNPIKYEIGHSVIDYGVRYYPDGSGEPPSEEIVDDAECYNLNEAIKTILLLNLEFHIDDVFMNIGEEEMEKQWQEYCDSFDRKDS